MSEGRAESKPRVEPRLPAGTNAPAGLLDAFWSYEAALMANDLPVLDALFADSPDTLRGDASGLLVGHEAISAFRSGRGGAPARMIEALHVRPIGRNAATVVAITRTPSGGRGQQTQVWRRDPERGWVVEVAHVAGPAPALNRTVWRVVGDPLVAGDASGTRNGSGSGAGPGAGAGTGSAVGPGSDSGIGSEAAGRGALAGRTVAVKDVFAVAGQRLGGGVRAYLTDAPVEERSAAAVQRLLDAGADVVGIAQTDQFAYSINGTNPDYGTPPNPAVVGGVPGGSSSGPASAVALGQVELGLGTDTGGSIRVPASYQGLWGLRTSHGAVRREGLLPLAPSFDTVGWLARDARTLADAVRVGLDAGPVGRGTSGRFAIAPAVLEVLQPEVGAVFEAFVAPLQARTVEVGALDELFETFRVVQGIEAWRTHGPWVRDHAQALAPDVASRFAWASTLTVDDEQRARSALSTASNRIRNALGDDVLLLPSTATVAPQTTASAAEVDAVRGATLRLTAIAGLAGLPALSAPLLRVGRPAAPGAGPIGLCLVGPRFSDAALLPLAQALADAPQS